MAPQLKRHQIAISMIERRTVKDSSWECGDTIEKIILAKPLQKEDSIAT